MSRCRPSLRSVSEGRREAGCGSVVWRCVVWLRVSHAEETLVLVPCSVRARGGSRGVVAVLGACIWHGFETGLSGAFL